MSRKEARIKQLWSPAVPASLPITGAQVGRICALEDSGLVTLELLPTRRRQAARLGLAASAERLHRAIESQQAVVVVFENGDAMRPIVIGFIEPAPTGLADQATAAAGPASADPVIEADVDGRRVRLVARDEIVLECGSASITLRRNGRVVIRGTHVESHSDGTNRVKGGQVRIN